MPRKRKMSEEELCAAVDRQLSVSLGGGDSSELDTQREKAMDYYLGEKYGNEMEGRSGVITREVMDTIEWIKPELMKIFASGQETVRFEPESPSDVEAAQQATDYINYVFNRKNKGFSILYQWVTDGLLQKNGIVKIWWDDTKEQVRESYEGLTEMQLQLLAMRSDIEIVEQEDYLTQEGVPLFNVDVLREGPEKGVRIENVPPEEFVIAKEAKCIQSSAFCAHRTQKTISDLKDMGYDVPDDLADFGEDLIHDAVFRARYKNDDTQPDDEATHPDMSMRPVWYTEAFIRTDFDGDGHAELRKVCKVGKHVFANEEVDCMPFAGWTPIIISHKFTGLSVADLVMDIQLIQSQLLRNILDNQYATNNGRYGIIDGMVNLDDLLTSRPTGVVRMKMPGAVQRLDTPQLGATAFQMLDYMDKLRERRTGVSERSQGLDPHSLGANQAATAVNQIMTAAQQRIELIARVFGETGLTDAFHLMYKLTITNDTQKSIFRLRDKFIEVDPSDWRDRADTSVVVGLGNGSKDAEMMQLGQIFQYQQMIAQNPAYGQLVAPANVYSTLEDMVKIFNKASAGRYFSDPTSQEAQQAAALAQEQQKQMEAKQDAITERQFAIEERKVAAMEAKNQLTAQQLGLDYQVDQQKVAISKQELAEDARQHNENIALDRADLEMEYELEKEQGRPVSLTRGTT